ncbi:hypothetical protein NDU88_003812 [Pleurodeles waltl]|uniref:Uncharacterized protein n=1 Tax=Pleurodeles waltl TaxID=8319 RepID=A0AAV7MRN5_PLEWA|nr:hypothetical protein NDU88_003812 [Pleurodeles waltl]
MVTFLWPLHHTRALVTWWSLTTGPHWAGEEDTMGVPLVDYDKESLEEGNVQDGGGKSTVLVTKSPLTWRQTSVWALTLEPDKGQDAGMGPFMVATCGRGGE